MILHTPLPITHGPSVRKRNTSHPEPQKGLWLSGPSDPPTWQTERCRWPPPPLSHVQAGRQRPAPDAAPRPGRGGGVDGVAELAVPVGGADFLAAGGDWGDPDLAAALAALPA